jgi:ribonuclease G
MDKELIINALPNEVEIALIEDGKLVELHKQKKSNAYNVGDIYLAKVNKLMPSLNAAFLDIGSRKDAFLHYTDLGPRLPVLKKYTDEILRDPATASMNNLDLADEIEKNGKIQDVMDRKTFMLAQILKEPISTKGPRLSCEITLPGRFLVLTPFSNAVTVSRKIANNDEKQRLQTLIESIKPKNFGVIIRTAAEGRKVAELHDEINMLLDKWNQMRSDLQRVKGQIVPQKLLSEEDKTTSILRDFLTSDFNRVVVNDKDLFTNVKSFLGAIAPDQVKIVELYDGKGSIFDYYGISKQIKASFGKTATLNSGAYIVIEHTEAMHVIDVNSGPKMSKSDLSNAPLSVNLEAAEEISRQLRLRDIGGLIIIDFIDMRNPDHKRILNTRMEEVMQKDRAQHTILPLSKFGLIQITRERVRQAIKINTDEVCPTCNGTGKTKPSILLIDDIERDLKHILSTRPNTKLTLKVHTYVYAHLVKGWPSIRMRWYMKLKKWIKIVPDTNFAMPEYKFFDVNGDEIRFT